MGCHWRHCLGVNPADRRGQARREQAKATRRRIVDSAYEPFCAHGYAATTMEMIATAAAVATQTVHYVFRTKAALLQKVIEVAAAGQHDPPPAMERPWIREALAAEDGRRTLARSMSSAASTSTCGWRRSNAAIQTAASIVPDIDLYWRSVSDARRRGMGELVAALDAKQQLQDGLTTGKATDLLSVVHSHETFLGLTRDSNWPLEEYKAWLYITLCQQLLIDRNLQTPTRQRPPEISPSTT